MSSGSAVWVHTTPTVPAAGASRYAESARPAIPLAPLSLLPGDFTGMHSFRGPGFSGSVADMTGGAPVIARRHVDPGSRRKAVALAEAYLRAHIDVAVRVSLLSQLVGLSERGLRDAFYQVRGMGPKRWIVSERLQGVRHALTQACAEPTTVTDAAVNHGFYELGRFAGIYRAAFGEAPSDTLRSTQKIGATPRRNRTCHCLRQHVSQPAP